MRFRSGPVSGGVALAIMAADVLPGLATTPAVATGIAAATAAVLRVPFTAVLLASLLVGASAGEVVPIAVLAAAVGWIVATALPDREDRRQETQSAAAPAGA
jgi:H+/Cl- antiporter ClcA